jgi:YHS domain-containing protein
MKTIQLGGLLLSIFVAAQSYASGSQPTPDRNIKEYNVENNGLSLKGYDPVAYFTEGGGQAVAGKEELSFEYKQVTYLFSSQKNLDLFKSNPNKYEPTYGNWCAFAMASNQKVDVVPTLFTISGNRLHLFISAGAKLQFDGNIPAFERRADANWKRISGESPRK